MDKVAAKMTRLGYRASELMVRPSAALIAEYERRFQLRLPRAYRRFLLRFGGYIDGHAFCPFQEPTPYPDPVDIGSFAGFFPTCGCGADIRFETEGLAKWAPPVFAPVTTACGNTCLVAIKCSGPDAGHVYLFDELGLDELPDEKLVPRNEPAGIDHRGDAMKRYIELRRAHRLPARPPIQVIFAPSGLKVPLFRLATDFEEFLDGLRSPDEVYGRAPERLDRTSGSKPLHRLYRLLQEAGDRPFAIDFDRRRRVLWVTGGDLRAGARDAEWPYEGRIRVSYLEDIHDRGWPPEQVAALIREGENVRSEICTPEEAVALLEAVMSGERPPGLPKQSAEPLAAADGGRKTSSSGSTIAPRGRRC